MLRDGGASARVGDYSYWIFADTQDGYVDVSGVVHISYYSDNSISATMQVNGSKGITLGLNNTDANGNLQRFVTWSEEDKAWMTAHAGANCAAGSECGAQLGIWPQTIVYDPTGKQVIVGFDEIKRFGGISGYPTVGQGLAVGPIGANGWPQLARPDQGGATDNPTLMWGPGELAFTNGALILNGDYYAYAYGPYWANYVARVSLTSLTNKSAWTYYAGNGNWVSDVSKAVSVFGGGTGNDVFYDEYLGQYVTIYLTYNTNQVYVRVAAAPEGPWSEPEPLATVPLRDGKDYGYIAHIHPEFSDHGRTIEFTYTISPGTNRQVLPVWSVKFNKPS